MKKLIKGAILTAALAGAINASANQYTLSNLSISGDPRFYTWGIGLSLAANESITGATLDVIGISEPTPSIHDKLYINLLDTAAAGWSVLGPDTVPGNEFAGNPAIDAFSAQGWTANLPYNFSYDFASLSILDDLVSFVAAGDDTAIGFDSDCDFTVQELRLTINTHVPDGGLTFMLLGASLVGLEGLRRRFAA